MRNKTLEALKMLSSDPYGEIVGEKEITEKKYDLKKELLSLRFDMDCLVIELEQFKEMGGPFLQLCILSRLDYIDQRVCNINEIMESLEDNDIHYARRSYPIITK